MKFGDIVRTTNNEMMVLNANNKLQKIGESRCYEDEDIYIDISFGIPKSKLI